MAPTSDERREVARKIREYVDAYGDKIEDAEMVLLGTVWCRGEFNEVVKPTSEAELLAMVADLIDPPEITEDTSDGYHTFGQLYYQRMALFAVLVQEHKDCAWKTWNHEDGEPCFGGGWFLVTIDTPRGAYGYHFEEKYWRLFDCTELPKAKHWDGYTEENVNRLFSLNCYEVSGDAE